MAYVPSVTASPREFAPEGASAGGRSLWQRIFEAIVAARQSQAEREIAFYLERIGGKFTDDVEREIESRFLFDPRR
jgi:hypothetical protein